MAGNITDLLSRVSDSNTGRPIIGELAAPGKAIGASSLNLAAATNWTTESVIYFSIYETTTVGSLAVKDTTTQTDWKGTLSGTTISNLTITGGTDRAYTAGAIVEQTPTSRYAKDLYDNLTVGHNQNGTHKVFTETSIVPTAALQDSSVTNAKIANGTISSSKIDSTTVPAFIINKSATQNSVVAGSVIAYTNELLDTHAAYNTTNSQYTAPVKGLYMVTCEAFANNSTNTGFVIGIYKNGVIYARGGDGAGAANEKASVVSSIIPLSIGDYIDVRVVFIGASSSIEGAAGHLFSGVMVVAN